MFLRLLAFICLATTINCDSSTAGKYVKLPVVRSTNQKVFPKASTGERAISTVPLANRSDVAYYAKLNIGTPAQEIFVQLDTGSFELWVNPDCNTLESSTDVRFCQAVGRYDPSASSTAVELPGTKLLEYAIGNASVEYVTDTISLTGSTDSLQNVQFGVAFETSQEFAGILGIGYGINMTIRYKNLVDQLADQGVTNTKAFSLALGSKDDEEGVIIFGGLDTSKFTGTLQTLPIIPPSNSPDRVARYWIQMNSVSLRPPSGQVKEYANTSLPVFLDSGSTLSLLPTAVAEAISADFGGQANTEAGFYLVDCSLRDESGTVDFAFDGVTIHVPYSEFIREFASSFGSMCALGISPSDDFTLLGDTVLRSAYAVFDQTNNAIHLAEYVNCGSNEVEITTKLDMGTVKGDCNSLSFPGSNSTTASDQTSATETNSASALYFFDTTSSSAIFTVLIVIHLLLGSVL
ncbi:aspartic peptidase domain-containing protein [Xylariaceae sp. FL1272]|nr:aspartic peptidase domain-containing protein [Xylariaceae sp. FL1272]